MGKLYFIGKEEIIIYVVKYYQGMGKKSQTLGCLAIDFLKRVNEFYVYRMSI